MTQASSHLKQYERVVDDSPASCAIGGCSAVPSSTCSHCEQHFCQEHSVEHENQCGQTLSHYVNSIDRLLDQMSLEKPYCFEQLEQWRQNAYRSVDHYCKKKREELFERKQQQLKQELICIRNRLAESIEDGSDLHAEWHQIDHDIQLTEMRLIELEHLRLKVRPLIVDEGLVNKQCLFPLSPPHHTIRLKSGNESSIGSNDRHLLVERHDKHLFLLDRNFAVVSEIPFPYDTVHSICWSSAIHRFIVVTFHQVFTFDDRKMQLEETPVSSTADWWRATCSDDILFLSSAEWGSSIHEFDLQRNFQFVKSWYSPVTCKEDEVICDLKYSNAFLAVPIFNKYKEESRLDLRSSATLDCLWSVRIRGRCRCCTINGDQWLVMDHDDRRFFHISAGGRLLNTDRYEQHQRLEDVTTWDEDTIIVLTKKAIHLHEIR